MTGRRSREEPPRLKLTTRESAMKTRGIGAAKADLYLPDFLQVIKRHG